MLRTKSIVSSVVDVPREWVFEYYLKLPVKLSGQDVKIKSPFNPGGDKNPSFFIYYSRNSSKYMFKDFSTDKQGDGVTLIRALFNLTTRGEAAHMIIQDYNKYVLDNPNTHRIAEFKVQSKYKVTGFTPRHWNKLDEKFWMSYRIGSKMLRYYNVQPLADYTLIKEHEGGAKDKLVMNGTQMYGYFRKDGTLYKVYQPYTKKSKFIKVVDYIQGTDQLTVQVPYLVICSSLKDLMCFMKLGFKNAEAVAPDSENTLIPERIINNYKKRYKAVCTLFDNDPAGIKSMEKYQEKYDLPFVHLELEKDLADCIKEHGINNTRVHAYPLLTKALTGTIKHI
jgi:hypothetical protein